MDEQVISGSVGRGGANRIDDVRIVQQLLYARGHVSVGTPPGGTCDAATIAAIRDYQSAYMRKPDGVIDVGWHTWRLLSAS